MNVVITDGYSPSNLGDLELVLQTIAVVEAKYGVTPTVLATDSDGFNRRQIAAKFVQKPISRVEWRKRSRVRKFGWLFEQVLLLGAFGATSFLPHRLTAQLVKAGRNAPSTNWFHELMKANKIVGVGGGYLGDRYLRESLVTLFLYWSALRSNKSVETMPVSITSIDSFWLRFLFKRTAHATWRVRERVSYNLLQSIGVSSELVPDLAWLNARSEEDSTSRTGILVAPVGAKFYATNNEDPKLWAYLEPLLQSAPKDSEIKFVAMHTTSPELGDGGDEVASSQLANLVQQTRPDLKTSVLKLDSYEQVKSAMRHSSLALAERLHAALAGLTTETPTLVVGYEPKHKGVLELAGLQQLCITPGAPFDAQVSEIKTAALRQAALVKESVYRCE